MVKKGKQGKERLDKFYHLAKDHGYRARSAFKLIQLAKKFDFLSKSRVCIDLCAAPGGWSQVAQRNMPSGAQIIAIDLAPIKAIQGVTCIQSDITSDKCRSILKRELKGNAADVVLHDGAPNVGSAWAKDAYGQAELTLHSLRLACEHLRPGGTFVTKVFRSADYNSLLWVFNQLFNKVEATKPTASRNVSAEIFVLCAGFKNAKIDPRFFDPKWVFMETINPDDGGGDKASSGKSSGAALNDLLKSQTRRHRNGYEPGDDLRIIAAHEFLASPKPAEMLVTSHQLNLDAPGSEDLAANPLTTPEIRDLCADLKVLGKGDLSVLMKWRMKYLREQQRREREKQKSAAAAAAASGPSPGPEGSATAAAPDPTSMLQQDVNEAIAGFLDEAAGKHGKAEADGKSEAGSDDGADDEDIENELAEQVEKRRREEKREAKKTMARQKKQEWRRKLSLDVTKQAQDMPELFRGNQRSMEALENGANYTEKWALDSDQEEDSDGDPSDGSGSDSDDKLDRLARLEVDVAVAEELQKLRSEDKNRTQMQRKRKEKKETRRKRVLAAWAGEFGAFNEAIDRQASATALRDQEEGDDEEDDDDDDDEEDGDAALSILRDAQSGRPLALEDGGAGAAGFDAEALRASADGPGAADPAADSHTGSIVESTGAGESRLSRNDTSEEALRAKQRAARWFSNDVFRGLGDGAKPKRDSGAIIPLDRDSDEDSEGSGAQIREVPDSLLPRLPLTDKEKRRQKRKREKERAGRFSKKSKLDEEDAGPLEIAPLEAPKPLVRPDGTGGVLKPSDPQELAETLALGSLLVDSKKSRMDIIDAAYNRWTFDADEGLPDWFTEEEEKNNKPELPITKELMAQFRAKLREINARPIRKVAEARARKKRRLNKRLEKLRATAMNLSETPDMSDHAKARQMRRAVSKMARQDQRKVSVVAVKKGGGGKRMEKKAPKGAKLKVVDKRMKSDRRGERAANKRDKGRQKAIARRQQKKKKTKGKFGGGGGGGRSRESGGKNGTPRGSD